MNSYRPCRTLYGGECLRYQCTSTPRARERKRKKNSDPTFVGQEHKIPGRSGDEPLVLELGYFVEGVEDHIAREESKTGPRGQCMMRTASRSYSVLELPLLGPGLLMNAVARPATPLVRAVQSDGATCVIVNGDTRASGRWYRRTQRSISSLP
jgi:hypothetical protein